MWLNNNIFGKKQISIPNSAEVIFVSDLFVDQYSNGGAEKTSEALIDSSQFEVYKLQSKDLTMEILEKYYQKYWIFGNFSGLDLKLIPTIIKNLKYSCISYDYSVCSYRSYDLHKENEGSECGCEYTTRGKLISSFLYGAKHLFWMSEKQKALYNQKFPFLSEIPDTVLSSVFDNDWFVKIKFLREKYKDEEKSGAIYLSSPSWIKGASESKDWIEKNLPEESSEGLWGLSYDKMLEKMAQSKYFVSLPPGGDTCPRCVCEAKLLGCKLVLNENVQHKNEEWFSTEETKKEKVNDVEIFDVASENEILECESYLYASRKFFWNQIKKDMDYKPTLSTYYYLRNVKTQKYPWRSSIRSTLDISDEVVILVALDDNGDDDGTWLEVKKWAEKEPKLKIASTKINWNHSRFGRFDGELKAMARDLCSGDYCLQMDSDEILHEDDVDKWKKLIENFPKDFDLLALPIVEFWGHKGKFRMDVNPYKLRLSKGNKKAGYITHGIPKHLIAYDENNELYCGVPGADDGCSYIHSETKEPIINCGNFYTKDVHYVRLSGLNGNEEHQKEYENWINNILESPFPIIWHYSWKDLPRKIRTYRDYWTKHWNSLFNQSLEDTAETNMFFNKPWSEVSEEEIEELAERLERETGGHIFHSKIDFSKPIPSITINKNGPIVLIEK